MYIRSDLILYWLQYHLMTLFPVLVDVYHKEKLVTKEEVDKVASDDRRWGDIAVIKDVSTAMRIAEILDKYDRRYNIFARHIRGKYVCITYRTVHVCVIVYVCFNN